MAGSKRMSAEEKRQVVLGITHRKRDFEHSTQTSTKASWTDDGLVNKENFMFDLSSQRKTAFCKESTRKRCIPSRRCKRRLLHLPQNLPMPNVVVKRMMVNDHA